MNKNFSEECRPSDVSDPGLSGTRDRNPRPPIMGTILKTRIEKGKRVDPVHARPFRFDALFPRLGKIRLRRRIDYAYLHQP